MMQTNFGFDEEEGAWDGVFELTTCRRALSPSSLPGIDYALNPYGGCEHGCVYCYAPEVTHQPWDGWRVVRVRTDIADRLVKELPGLSGVVGIGTVTDPYQGAEARFCLTRRCLNVLKAKGFPVHIHTKSPLILRDLPILKGMDAVVGVTVTGTDVRSSLIMEPGAPVPAERFRTLKALVSEGVDCYALVEPVMSTVQGMEKEFADAIADTGVKRALVGGLNGRPELNKRLARMHIDASSRSEILMKTYLRARGIKVEDAL